ncbi:MAG: Fe-S cluster assembly protein SufB [Bacilli bacterium]|nr:Fe-S cluster assembly protein SufB [Bacilli bacterium]
METNVKLDEKLNNIYNLKTNEEYEKTEIGLNKEIVERISKEKEEPDWVLNIRLKALEFYEKLDLPNWGPDLSEIKLDDITTYIKPKNKMADKWEDVPEDIKNVFDKLGIPEAEKKSLGGVGAQYDSEMVYHRVQDELKEKGVIYTNFDTAIKEYPDLVKEYFSKAVPINDHKFIAMHYALFSGGSFVYVPKGVVLTDPLQSYFRLNSPGAGQFEHTLIIVEEGASLQFIEGCSAPGYNELNLHAGCVELFVKDNAFLRFSTIENWSKNMMNLNTKKAIVGERGKLEWIMGSFGSKVSMLYPMTILNGDYAKCEFTGISFAGSGQNLDTGIKVIHNGKHTSTVVNSKSISKDGGICTFRSNIWVKNNSVKSKLNVSCESLMLDSESRSDTIPVDLVENDDIEYAHEAKIGKISDESIFYLMSRGLSEEEALKLIVRGFAEPISKAFPIEYAVEMNRLIDLELEGTIG